MKAIVCVDADWGIGKNNGLLVYNPIDMNFKFLKYVKRSV